MVTVAKERSCRIDIRLTRPQRTSYERAAALKGQTLSQWTTQHLDECARRDIDEARATQLDDEAFDAFCRMLEAPLPKAAAELLAREEIWI